MGFEFMPWLPLGWDYEVISIGWISINYNNVKGF
jgi:hypothetical protein